MIIGRLLGWLFLTVALMASAAELAAYVDANAYSMLSMGDLWRDIHPGTFSSARVWIEHEEYLDAPWLWDPLVVTLLNVPAWPLFCAAAATLLYLCRHH